MAGNQRAQAQVVRNWRGVVIECGSFAYTQSRTITNSGVQSPRAEIQYDKGIRQTMQTAVPEEWCKRGTGSSERGSDPMMRTGTGGAGQGSARPLSPDPAMEGSALDPRDPTLTLGA